ncbi:hydroxyethylthiazole kinase [Rickettsiella massiliensis]|uniref:hydroxyethylthiazole kinase n=1 Tax=Rickettsiella massiliensis TaxID=676517 RepID=UPI0009FE6F7F|nr:hydroxyethylthiazole kinase [Rickettsiella massiliensis]
MMIKVTPFNLNSATLFADLDKIRKTNPLIHNLSNLVVMPIIANLLLALGASPIMAHAPEELVEIVTLSKALVINIGTLDKNWLRSIEIAQEIARQTKIPIVFDPVGASASRYRLEAACEILERGVTVLRGNASEIMSLVNMNICSKGVDSLHQSDEARLAALELTKHYHCTVAISGKTDWIISEKSCYSLDYGTPLFTKVVGMGCSLTAIIASFLAVHADPVLATAHAVALFTLCGQFAATKTSSPGHFYNELLDIVYQLDKKKITSLIGDRNI